MMHLLMAHPGAHHVPTFYELTVIPFFRRLRLRRRPSVPAELPPAAELRAAGAAAALAGDRYACCAHCLNGFPCDPRDSHLAPCGFGCNDPVLGDKLVSEVRAEYDARRAREHADAMHAGYARAVDRLRADAGLPTAAEMRDEYFGLPKRRTEPGKPPWFTSEHPVYGQAPVADVLKGEQEGREVA